MINTGIIRTENAAGTHSGIKSAVPEQKLQRTKSKALGDVQNTLHSRPGNFGSQITNSAVKASTNSSVKSTSYETYLLSKSSSEKKINVTPSKSVLKRLLSTPSFEKEIFEAHNHILCGQEDQQAYLNDFFSDYKFSEEQINNLVRSVRVSSKPLTVPFYEPCEDLMIPQKEKYEAHTFSLSDILNDIIIPEVPPIL